MLLAFLKLEFSLKDAAVFTFTTTTVAIVIPFTYYVLVLIMHSYVLVPLLSGTIGYGVPLLGHIISLLH